MSTTETKIEWCDRTWNPVRGCSRISEGCRNCYAERVAARFSGTWSTELEGRDVTLDTRDAPGKSRSAPFRGFAEMRDGKARWTGKVELVPDALDAPLRWRKPARIFVNSMSDLFHEGLSNEDIAAVFGVMAAAPQHTFLVLTKRAERARRWFEWARVDFTERQRGLCAAPNTPRAMVDAAYTIGGETPERKARLDPVWRSLDGAAWPLPNVWLGVSVEDQAAADARIPHLLATPAAVRFVSYEPALGRVWFDFALDSRARDIDAPAGSAWHEVPINTTLDWLIVGGESGPGARPFDVAWARSAVDQCKAAGVPVFVKQLGARPVLTCGSCGHVHAGWPLGRICIGCPCPETPEPRLGDRKGGEPSEWAEDLRVREFPASAA